MADEKNHGAELIHQTIPDVAETEPRPNGLLQELVDQACCRHGSGNGHGYQGLTRYCDECGLNWPRGTNPHKHTTEALMVVLRKERDEAQRVVRDTLWMAGRYADGRRSYAVGLYNDALAIAQAGGYAEGAKPARDGMLDLIGCATEIAGEASASLPSAAP
jgi:hypothetical protein